MRMFFRIILSLALLTCATGASAGRPDASEPRRPRVGLVLAGGGALGFAHVGVLKVLEENRVPVDVITGTSMGSIVGAAYASGRTVLELEKVLSQTDWDVLFDETSDRRNVPYRYKPGRKREMYGSTKFGFKDEGGLALPGGVVSGQNILPLLQSLYANVPNPVTFDELPVPFRAVAADIETGEAYVPARGNLSLIVRASMSVPGFFNPLEMDGKLLVDGGITNNLPIDIARNMGAERFIVVELYADLKKHADLKASPLAVTGQVVSLLLAQNSAIQRQSLRPEDVLIEPKLTGYSSTDFNKAFELMALGEQAARRAVPRLKEYSVSEQEYRAYQEARTGRPYLRGKISYIEVRNNSGLPEAQIRSMIGIQEGEPFDRLKLEQGISQVYNLGQFEGVRYETVDTPQGTGVIVNVERKSWYDRYLRLGMSVEDDFETDSRYRIGGSYRTSSLNRAGAFADIEGEIGSTPRLAAELYQPFAAGSPYFIAPTASIGRSLLFPSDNGDELARYHRTEEVLGIRSGTQLGALGEGSLGYSWGFGDLARDVGDPELPELSYHIGTFVADLTLDDTDSPDFPIEGFVFNTSYSVSFEDIGSSDSFNQLNSSASLPISFGRNTLLLRGECGYTFHDLPVERSYALGGFFNIPGFAQGSVLASDYAAGHLLFYRRFSEVKLPFFGFNMFAGLTFDYASVRSDIPRITDEPSIVGGSTFFGADTPLLPVYLGFGGNDEHEASIYFAMGRLSAGRR